MKSSRPGAFVGIDFGTSNCSVARLLADGRIRPGSPVSPDVMEFEAGDMGGTRSKRFPTVVGANLDPRKKRSFLAGFPFLAQFFDRKRRVRPLRHGRDFFRSVKSDLGTSKTYHYAAREDLRTPVGAAAAVLRSVVEAASDFVEVPRGSWAVSLTIPAAQYATARRETLEAAVLARLDIEQVDLLDEPIAALIDLLFNNRAAALITREPKNILVFDFGGGTCDLALVRASFEPEAASGLKVENLSLSNYQRLGGDDIDRDIMRRVVWPCIIGKTGFPLGDYPAAERKAIEDTLEGTVARTLKERMCDEIRKAVRGMDGHWDPAFLGKIRVSAGLNVVLTPSKGPAFQPSAVMTLEEFQEVMAPYTDLPEEAPFELSDLGPRSLLRPVFETLEKGGLERWQLDGVVLHGIGCRNPFVRRALRRALGGGETTGGVAILETPDLETSVARGAAIASWWRHEHGAPLVQPIVAEEIGVITAGEIPKRLVPSGTLLPFPDEDGVHEVQEEFFVSRDGQRELLVPLCRGKDQRIAGSVRVALPRGVRAGDRIRVLLRIDADKRLHWWFRLGNGTELKADSIDDPWTADVDGPGMRELMVVRAKIRTAREEALAQGEPLGDHARRRLMAEEAWRMFHAADQAGAFAQYSDLEEEGEAPPEVFNMLGLLNGRIGRKEEALRCARIVADMKPMDPVYQGNLGAALFDADNHDEAEAHLRRAVELDPDLAYVYEILGDLQRRRGRETAAREEYEQALRVHVKLHGVVPEGRDPLRARMGLLRELGRYREADEMEAVLRKVHRDERLRGDSANLMAGQDSGLWPEERLP